MSNINSNLEKLRHDMPTAKYLIKIKENLKIDFFLNTIKQN